MKLTAISGLAIAGALALTGCQIDLSATGSHTTAAAGSTVTVPRVVGQRLRAAEDTFDAAGLKNATPIDASDRHREVIDSTNWVVTAQAPKAGAKVAAGSKVTLTVNRPTDGYGPKALHLGVVPDVTCMNLQDAQDALRKSAFFNLRSSDGSGRGRIQILDRDWLVTAQSMPPGKGHSPLSRIVLSVVKYAESTGRSGCPS